MASSDLERAIAEYRRKLTAQDAAAQARLVASYRQTQVRLIRRIQALGPRGAVRQDPARLLRSDRYHALVGQIETELHGLGAATVNAAQNQQRVLAHAAVSEAARLADLQRPGLAAAFTALPTGAVESLVGMLSDGSPLAASAGEIFGKMTKDALAALEAGVASGEGPQGLIRSLNALTDASMARRVMPLVRGALLGAHRQASLETYRANSDIVSGYKRLAAKAGNTCLVCLALDGTVYPLDRMLPTHPNCRCALVPIVKGFPLDWETGADWFARQPEGFQRARLGPEAFAAFRAGAISLSDFVDEVDDPRWGPTLRTRSRAAVLGRSAAKPAAAAPAAPFDPLRPPPAMLQREAAIRQQHFESAAWYDAAGHEVGFKDGAKASVDFTPAEIATMKDTVLTHNHPLGWDFPPSNPQHAGNSFSDADILFTVEANLRAIRALGAKATYTLIRPPGGWGLTHGQTRAALDAADASVRKEFQAAINSGRITVDEANARHHHEKLTRLLASTNLDWKYVREEEP